MDKFDFTLKTMDAFKEQYETPRSIEEPIVPIFFVLDALVEQQTWRNVNMQAYVENGQYVVIVEQQYESPIDDAVFIAEPVLGGREAFAFDRETGHLMYREVQILLQNSSWLVTEREEYLRVEYVPELPFRESQLLNSALNSLMEEK